MITADEPLVVKPEELDQPHGGPLVVKPEELDGGEEQPKQPGMLSRAMTGANNFADEALQMTGLPRSISDIPRWGKHMLGQEPGQKSSLSEMVDAHKEAGAKSPVGYVPIIGPISVRASDNLNKHEYGRTAADLAGGVAALSPFKGPANAATSAVKDTIGDVVRNEAGEIRPGLKATGKLAGLVGGGAAGEASGIPHAGWAGAAAGAKYGDSLLDAMMPARSPRKLTPFTDAGDRTWLPRPDGEEPGNPPPAHLPDANEFYESKGKDLIKRGKEQEALDRKQKLASKVDARDNGSVTQLPIGSEQGRGPLTPEQVPGKPQLRRLAQGGDPRAGAELQRRGEKVLYHGEEYPKPRDSTTFRPGEAEPERRVGGSGEPPPSTGERRQRLTDMVGPSPMRKSLMDDMKSILDDPKATTRDKQLAQDRLSDLKGNPFERHEGGDINQMKASGKKTLSREEAEANTAKRAQARNQRFGGTNE